MTATFGYDAAGELVSQTSSTGPATTYTYDDLGHRATLTASGVVTTYRYDDAGQLCWTSAGSAVNANACGSPPAGATVYAYDLAGRMLSSTSVTTTNYGYDPAGQLQTVRLTGGAYDTTQTRSYSPSGDLIGLANTGTDTTSTTLSWDDAGPLPTLATQTSGPTTSDLLYGAGQWAIALTGGTTAGIGLDALGNVIPTTATQGIAAADSYDAWGSPDAGADPLNAALGYRGELQTGDLVDLRARNYDTSIGAFTSTDPLDGVNGQATIAALYAYANNNPIANIDPTGKAANDWNAFAAAWNIASGNTESSAMILDEGQCPNCGYVYVIRAQDGTIKYVGKSIDPPSRLPDHERTPMYVTDPVTGKKVPAEGTVRMAPDDEQITLETEPLQPEEMAGVEQTLIESFGLDRIGNAIRALSPRNRNYQAYMNRAAGLLRNGTDRLRDQLVELGAGNLAATQFGESLDELPQEEGEALEEIAVEDLELTMGTGRDPRLRAVLAEIEDGEFTEEI